MFIVDIDGSKTIDIFLNQIQATTHRITPDDVVMPYITNLT